MSIIIGIDPGSKTTGYGIIRSDKNKIYHIDCGGIHIPDKLPIGKRLLFIYNEIKKLLTEFGPDHAGVEDVFFAKNAKSTLMLGQVRGIVLLALEEAGVPHFTYPAREVKKAITGYGNATKEQIQYMVQRLLKLKETAFEDASDALAVAICHANTSGRHQA